MTKFNLCFNFNTCTLINVLSFNLTCIVFSFLFIAYISKFI